MGAEEEILCLDVADNVGGRGVEPARLDVLKRDVELGLLRRAAVDGSGDKDVSFLTVHAPQARSGTDDGAWGVCL
jgi:hypothetical protein